MYQFGRVIFKKLDYPNLWPWCISPFIEVYICFINVSQFRNFQYWGFAFLLILFLGIYACSGQLMQRVDSLEKTLMLGGQEEKGTTEDEMAGWHHWLDGHECEWTPGVGDGQGGLACCDSWGRKELDITERLNWTEHACYKSTFTLFLICSQHK